MFTFRYTEDVVFDKMTEIVNILNGRIVFIEVMS